MSRISTRAGGTVGAACAKRAGRLPPLSARRQARRPLLDGRRCRRCAWAQPLCPPVRDRAWQDRQLGRCRDRRAWRSCRSHPVEPAAWAIGRHHRRGRTLPQPATIGDVDDVPLPQSSPNPHEQDRQLLPTTVRRLEAARRIAGGSYLRSRGITRAFRPAALRFHPRCYYRRTMTICPGTPGSFPGTDRSGDG
jgi:hypothetical protein